MKRIVLLLAVIGLLTTVSFWLFGSRTTTFAELTKRADGHSELTKRAPTVLTDLAEPIKINGNCLQEALVQTAGDTSQGQTYLLTIKLKSNPQTNAELNQLLAQEECAQELTQLRTDLSQKTAFTAAPSGSILFSYLTSKGNRFLAPN